MAGRRQEPPVSGEQSDASLSPAIVIRAVRRVPDPPTTGRAVASPRQPIPAAPIAVMQM